MKNQFENLFLLVLFLMFFLLSWSVLIAEDSDTLWTKNFMGSGYVSNALFSPDDKSIYVTTTEKFYELETETGKIIREIPEIRGMARYLNNQKYFLANDYKLYTYPEMKFVKDYKVSYNFQSLNSYDIDNDFKRFAEVLGKPYPDTDSCVIIRDIISDTIIFSFKTKESYRNIIFSPNGKYFVTGSWDLGEISVIEDNKYNLCVWDAENYKELKIINKGKSDESYTNYMKFSPDGNYFAYLNSTHIFLYNTQTWQLLDTFNFDKPSEISSFNFSNDSKFIYFCGSFNKINKYQIDTKTLIYLFNPEWTYKNINFSNNDNNFVTTTTYRVILFNNNITTVDDNKVNILTFTPNPVKDSMEISGLEFPVKNISIFDINGNLVFTNSNLISSEANLSLDLSFLQTGTYIINIKTSDNEYSAKFIKE